jgi:hypothetical protein
VASAVMSIPSGNLSPSAHHTRFADISAHHARFAAFSAHGTCGRGFGHRRRY